MVIQRTIENLRERPKDERRAVALGIAIAVVVILFFGWAIFFFGKVRSENTPAQINTAYTSAVNQGQGVWDSSAPPTASSSDAEASSTTGATWGP